MSLFSDVVKCTGDSRAVKQKCPIVSGPNVPMRFTAVGISSVVRRPYLPHSSSGTSE